MSGKNSDPPKLAVWLLQRACPASDSEALAGDLVERFREGQTRGWFWRQVLIAFAVGVLGKIREHWPHFCYAIAGTAIALFLGQVMMQLARAITWPFSMLVSDLTADALTALSALPVLAVTLALRGMFRWASLLRTWVISISLFAIHLYLVVFRTTGPYLIPPVLLISLYLFILLFSAWLGCPSPRRTTPTDKPAETA